MSKVYNLQIPISKDLESKLKELAKQDERHLRVYCRRLLQDHVDSCEFEPCESFKDEIEVLKSEPVQQEETLNVVENVVKVDKKEEVVKIVEKVVLNDVKVVEDTYVEEDRPRKLGKLTAPKK